VSSAPTARAAASIPELAQRAKTASRALAAAPTTAKNEALLTAADLLVKQTDEICAANAADVRHAETDGTPAPLVDRLRLSPARIEAMADGLRQITSRPDPVGLIADGWTRPNGLRI